MPDESPDPGLELALLRRLDWLERQVATLRATVVDDQQALESERQHAIERLARLRVLEESAATAQRDRDHRDQRDRDEEA